MDGKDEYRLRAGKGNVMATAHLQGQRPGRDQGCAA